MDTNAQPMQVDISEDKCFCLWFKGDNTSPYHLTLAQAQDVSAAILRGAQHLVLFDEIVPTAGLFIQPLWKYLDNTGNLSERMVTDFRMMKRCQEYVEKNFPNGALSQATLEKLGLLKSGD